ncbi:unnamed protein product [Adineta steineri]|uniref:Uncharacterized protein n=2 Tax=Adineta steineri TaxID=433720 RepID=A0A815TWG0_9BILA|nr:unnamed protein product [Adineta steineri]
MNRIYFVFTISILITILYPVNPFFLENVALISTPTTIACRSNNNVTQPSDFQLCVIRKYVGNMNGDEADIYIYNGLHYINSFDQYIGKYCQNFSSGTNDTNIGSGFCSPAPFETFLYMQLCICATDNCNQDMTTCNNSAYNTSTDIELDNLMPNLTSLIQCDYTSNSSVTCTEQPYVNISACEDYVRNNTVLCAITINGTQTIQESLTNENYERYLSDKLYQWKSSTSNNLDFGQTDTNFNYNYFVNNAVTNECFCTTPSYCNDNYDTCVSQTSLHTQATMSATSSISNTTISIFTSAFNGTAVTSTAATSVQTVTSIYTGATMTLVNASLATSVTAASATSNTITSVTTHTNASSTNNPITSVTTNTAASATSNAITSVAANTTASATNSAITSVTTNAITSVTNHTNTSSTNNAITSVTTHTATSATVNATTAINTNSTAITTMHITTNTNISTNASTTTISGLVGLEPGLGSAATAGIACGIIFSALLFIGEIVFFKFIYARNSGGGGAERSVNYHA